MKLLGLKGFSSLGRIDHYFSEGCFPDQFNWTSNSIDYVLSQYYQQYGDDEYILICYSDGGTVGHRLFLSDRRCRGIIAVGASHPRNLERLMPIENYKPVLLVSNKGDLTGMGFASERSYQFYTNYGFNTVLVRARSETWHKHDFAPCLPFAQVWCWSNFRYSLPIASTPLLPHSINHVS